MGSRTTYTSTITVPVYASWKCEHCGEINFVTARKRETLNAFIMGIDHPVKTFDGRVIASVEKNGERYFVVAPKSKRYINHDVSKAMEFFHPESIRCYYETSCGAIVCRKVKGFSAEKHFASFC